MSTLSHSQADLSEFENKITDGNNLLLMRVLKIHYKERADVLNSALTVIKEYSAKTASTQSEYGETSVALREMLKDLPDNIFMYFLTLLPLPKAESEANRDDSNNHDSIDVTSMLTDYVNKIISEPPNEPEPKPKAKAKIEINQNKSTSTTGKGVKKPVARSRRRSGFKPLECKKLLDICAEYVVQNYDTLSQDYHTMKEEAWRCVNSNKYVGDELEKLYGVIRDLNKKVKWLRYLDADEVSEEIIREVYYDENVFLMESNMMELINDDKSTISDELKCAIDTFLRK